MDEYESILIDRCIKNRYDFLEDFEKQKIAGLTKQLAKKDTQNDFPSYEERRAIVKSAVEKYMKTNAAIVPGGFVDFRLRELYFYVEQMVDLGAELFLKEKEYEEFTYLLSVFVSEKECREEVLHLLWQNNSIRLINKRGRDITEKYEREFYDAARDKGIGQEDLAISAVISAAPKKLVFHSPPPQSPLRETLEKIFEGKCRICPGCNICKKNS